MQMDLRAFLDDLQERLPYDFVRIERPVSPSQFEVTALLQHLENQRKFPVLFFEKPLDLNGKPSAFPLLSNVFATRQRCALSLGMKPNESELPLSLEYARREDRLLAPVTIPPTEAPGRASRQARRRSQYLRSSGGSTSCHGPGALYRHDAGHEEPLDEGFYNIAFQRNMVKGPRRLGLHMSPRHNWQIHRKNEEKNRSTPVAIVISHHPAFYLGSLTFLLWRGRLLRRSVPSWARRCAYGFGKPGRRFYDAGCTEMVIKVRTAQRERSGKPLRRIHRLLRPAKTTQRHRSFRHNLSAR